MSSEEMTPNASDICKTLKEIVDIIDYPRRIQILNTMPPGSEKTFKELKEATGISVGSLSGHLKEMWHAGLIDKTSERPAKYKRSEFLTYLISLILQGNRNVGDSLPLHWGQHRRVTVETPMYNRGDGESSGKSYATD
jgi:DNA-binding HxlR family transcriptional regulator